MPRLQLLSLSNPKAHNKRSPSFAGETIFWAAKAALPSRKSAGNLQMT